jgi:GNAT superfamily N-acetyltransferase
VVVAMAVRTGAVSVPPSFRSFEVGDGPAIASAWTAAAPADPIGYQRFRDLFLLDRNFDPAGLKVAVDNGQVVGAAYAVRRLVAAAGDDLEPSAGWIPFFFVHPDHRGRGLGRSLLTAALDWLRSQGRTSAFFSSYTPNYFLPGLDTSRYPAALGLLESLGFERQYDAVAMDRSLVGYEIPAESGSGFSGWRATALERRRGTS